MWGGVPPPLILSEKKEMTEGSKAGMASKTKPGFVLSSRFGSATAMLLSSLGIALIVNALSGLIRQQMVVTYTII